MDAEALKSAARAAIVMHGVFAFADQVTGSPQNVSLRRVRIVRGARARGVRRHAADL